MHTLEELLFFHAPFSGCPADAATARVSVELWFKFVFLSAWSLTEHVNGRLISLHALYSVQNGKRRKAMNAHGNVVQA